MRLRDQVNNFLIKLGKSKAIKFLLVKVLGSAVVAGPLGWLIQFAGGIAFDYIAAPIIRLVVRKGFLLIDRERGKLIIKRVNRAKEELDVQAYLDNISDV